MSDSADDAGDDGHDTPARANSGRREVPELIGHFVVDRRPARFDRQAARRRRGRTAPAIAVELPRAERALRRLGRAVRCRPSRRRRGSTGRTPRRAAAPARPTIRRGPRRAVRVEPVARALHLDVGIVVERRHAGRLGRAGHHHSDVFADLLQVADEFGVTGVEADAQSGEIRTLRQRMNRHHARRTRPRGSCGAGRST